MQRLQKMVIVSVPIWGLFNLTQEHQQVLMHLL